MITSEKLLSTVLHTTQMGQTGIRSVMPKAIRPDLKQELKAQLAEYDAIEKEAMNIAKRRGWQMYDINPALKTMSTAMARARLMNGSVDSKIAGMLIQGNTRGMITGIKNLHRSSKSDASVEALAERLVERESINIQKTQPFL